MYNRHTELRRLHERDEYNLATKLDEQDCGRLLDIIPHRINAQQCSNNSTLDWKQAIEKNGRKYSHEHLELLRKASVNGRSMSQIFLDEWKTSGRREERPTLGVLLQLLVGAECWRAADFLATELLHEPEPKRSSKGPEAVFPPPISENFEDVEDYLNGLSNCPNSTALEQYVNGSYGVNNNNQDYRRKFFIDKKIPIAEASDRENSVSVRMSEMRAHNMPTTEVVNGIVSSTPASIAKTQTQETTGTTLVTLLPRLSFTNTQNNPLNNLTATTITTNTPDEESILYNSRNIPPISTLMTTDRKSVSSSECMHSPSNITCNDNLSNTQPSTSQHAMFTIETAPIPALSIFNVSSNSGEEDMNEETPCPQNYDGLPQITELCINYEEKTNENDDMQAAISSSSNSNSNSSISNNAPMHNEHVFDQNNDSSLTSVTCTSGENSFEMSSTQDELEIMRNKLSTLPRRNSSLELEKTESDVTSQENIPCLSALK